MVHITGSSTPAPLNRKYRTGVKMIPPPIPRRPANTPAPNPIRSKTMISPKVDLPFQIGYRMS